MTNPYYTHTTAEPITQTRGRSNKIRTEFDEVEDGFDAVKTAVDLKAPLAAPTFTGTAAFETIEASQTIAAAGAILANGGQVTFPATQAPSTNANTMDDYEEAAGTTGWVPADGSGAGLSFTSVTAQYVKIGCMVFVQAELTYPATASGSAAKITGLPFAPRNGAIAKGSLSVGRCGAAMAVNAYISGSGGLEVINLVKAIAGTTVLNSDMSGAVIYFSGWYIAS